MDKNSIIKKWRFFEIKNGEYYTLFHGVNGSRKIPIDAWVTAKQSVGYEGSHGKKFRTGFHVFDSLEYGLKFISKFRKKRTIAIVEIEVSGKLRIKPTNNRILLCKYMRIPRNAKCIIAMQGNTQD